MASAQVQAISFWKDRRVLVTGAGGFIASWLSRALLDEGAMVVGIVRDSAGERLLGLHGIQDGIELVRGSITDTALVERVLNEYEIDTVYHLAAQALVVAANRSPLSTFESNIRGTWTVLEAARNCQTVSRIVVASSDKAYGSQAELPYHEGHPLNGRYPYDASKVCADVLAQSYAATFDLPVVVTRFANIYGGADLNWSRIIPGTIRWGLHGEQTIIRSDGLLERDYLFIEDAIRGYLAAGRMSGESGVRGRAFNFGSGSPIRVIDLAEKILEMIPGSLAPKVLGVATGEIDRQYLDSRLAHELLDWEPSVSLEQGLEKTIGWYARYFQVGELETMAGD
jgi:CDP-glucose 4,6-dehydratase